MEITRYTGPDILRDFVNSRSEISTLKKVECFLYPLQFIMNNIEIIFILNLKKNVHIQNSKMFIMNKLINESL